MSLPTNRRFYYYTLYWPFQWPLIYCLVFTITLFFYLKNESEKGTYSGDVMQLGGGIVIAFFLFLPLASMLTLVWSILFVLIKKEAINVRWHNNKLEINSMVQPMMGFVRVHLLHQKKVCSEAILLLPHASAGLGFLYGRMESAPLQSPDIVKAETLDGIVFHFEDPFRFFSISFFKSVSLERLQLPDANPANADWLYNKYPDRDAEQTTHVKRHSGDWLNLKLFEPGDDVRRIVWSLYARHKELMVRWQDQQHPHGDTLKVYVSFNALEVLERHADLFIYSETQYKQRLYALLSGLLHEGVLIDWRTAQNAWVNGISTQVVANEIARATWHTTKAQTIDADFLPPSLVFISSLEEVDDLEQLVKKWPEALFVFVGLFEPLFNRTWRSRMNALWFQSGNENNASLYDSWWRHPLKAPVLKNEQQLKKMLEQHTKGGGVYV